MRGLVKERDRATKRHAAVEPGIRLCRARPHAATRACGHPFAKHHEQLRPAGCLTCSTGTAGVANAHPRAGDTAAAGETREPHGPAARA